MEALRGFEPHPPLGGPTVRSPHGHSTGASTGDRTRISEVAPRNSPIEPSTQNTTWTTRKSAVTRRARTSIIGCSPHGIHRGATSRNRTENVTPYEGVIPPKEVARNSATREGEDSVLYQPELRPHREESAGFEPATPM